MATFNGQDLFASGPVYFRVGAPSLRHVTHAAPNGQGIQLASQGREAREITQAGTLTADTIAKIQQQIDAIETNLDGQASTLVDELERSWSNTVMIRFEPKSPVRIGVRWKLEYKIDYLQVMP